MYEQVKFNKKQIAVLQQMFVNANKSFIEFAQNRPEFHDESHRCIYVYSYIEDFFETLSRDGYAYLEE